MESFKGVSFHEENTLGLSIDMTADVKGKENDGSSSRAKFKMT